MLLLNYLGSTYVILTFALITLQLSDWSFLKKLIFINFGCRPIINILFYIIIGIYIADFKFIFIFL